MNEELLQRLLADPELRALYLAGGSPLEALAARESRSSLAGVALGVAVEGVAFLGLADVAEAAVPSLLENGNLSFDASGAADLRAGRIDPRVMALLDHLSRDHKLEISSMRSDHSTLTAGGSVSNHSVGRAFDIASVDGQPVRPGNEAARKLAESLASLDPRIRPTEIGSPWALSGAAYFTDADHQDHLHVGYDDPPGKEWQAPPAHDHDHDHAPGGEPAAGDDEGGDADADADTDDGGDTDDGDGDGDEREDGGSGDTEEEADEDDEEDDEEDEEDHDGEDEDEPDEEEEDEEDSGDGDHDDDSGDADDGDDGASGGEECAGGDDDADADSGDADDGDGDADDADSGDADGGDADSAPSSAADVAAGALAEYPGDSARKEDVAAWMAAQARARGLPSELPIMAALVESNLSNLNFGDADSVGFFQMRVGIWNQGAYAGYPERPELQLKWFLDTAEQVKQQRLARGLPIDDPRHFGDWIADVERPAEQYRGRYQLRLADARGLLERAASGVRKLRLITPEQAARARNG